ncbi:hypothetical protein AADZ86_06815 [Colwelliaceae bacterium BS250]
MFVNVLKAMLVLCCLSGCAERVIDIVDNDGKVVGGCNAGYDWHLYGLQDSIDYMLYQCAKESIDNGYTVSDTRLLDIDFTLPLPPQGKSWNKKLAMQQFHNGNISERKLGYILADIEYEYMKIVRVAEDDLADRKIAEAEFEQRVNDAKLNWLGE